MGKTHFPYCYISFTRQKKYYFTPARESIDSGNRAAGYFVSMFISNLLLAVLTTYLLVEKEIIG